MTWTSIGLGWGGRTERKPEAQTHFRDHELQKWNTPLLNGSRYIYSTGLSHLVSFTLILQVQTLCVSLQPFFKLWPRGQNYTVSFRPEAVLRRQSQQLKTLWLNQWGVGAPAGSTQWLCFQYRSSQHLNERVPHLKLASAQLLTHLQSRINRPLQVSLQTTPKVPEHGGAAWQNDVLWKIKVRSS